MGIIKKKTNPKQELDCSSLSPVKAMEITALAKSMTLMKISSIIG